MGYRAAILVLGLVLLALPTNADDRARLSIETEALFRTVMAEEAPPEKCEYDLVWSSLPTPAFVARKYLGSTLHADLLGPEPSGTYRDTLDPRKQHGDAFCSEADWAVYQKARFAAFDENTGAQHVRVARTSFTPPIFDAGYSIAVVIVSRSSFDRDRVSTQIGPFKPGDIIRHPVEIVDIAKILAKQNGTWMFRASEIIGQS